MFWGQHSPPWPPLPDVVESLVGVRERFAHGNRKTKAALLDKMA
jgi:hypothetical protein